MSNDQPERSSEADAELEREIRANRKFTLTEAIGRLAGPGMMKGVSPVSRMEQAQTEIREYLARHLVDAGGVLGGVLLRQVQGSELFLTGYEQPLVVLAGCVRHILDSDYALKELVREADVEWGQVYNERPYFEKEGCPPDPADPYTHASVRAALTKLVSELPSA